MEHRIFKPLMLLALILPLVVTYLGVSLFYGTGKEKTPVPVTSTEDQFSSNRPVQIYRSETARSEHPTRKQGIGNLEISLYIAILAGVIAFLYHYLKSTLVWIAILLLPLLFSLWGHSYVGLSLIRFYLPGLLFAVLLSLAIRYLFFNPSLLRFRMVLVSIVGAALLTLYYRSLYLFTGQPFSSDAWTSLFVSSIILFVFITFGMSLADLIIVQREVKLLKEAQRRRILDDEEDETEDVK